jgi:carboxypeptidase Q
MRQPDRTRIPLAMSVVLACALATLGARGSQPTDVERLVASLLGATPLVDDLRHLTDRIGGRATGSEANRRAVEWAVQRFREAGVDARTEAFQMPARWLERSAAATVSGAGVRFDPRVAAMPFATPTPPTGTPSPLVDAGRGGEADFTKLGDAARGAFVLVETDELKDIAGLFKEYADAAAIETRAFAAGVAGVVYMGSRPGNQLYRHNASQGPRNTRPMLIMERDGALRAQRLLRDGVALTITVRLDIDAGGPYESHNVIGEIPGAARSQEIVLMGAHLDSWDLGTGALDNGANVAMMIDLARQIRRLGLMPARTIRFALWNGEEQGIHGSWGYTKTHRAELDAHVVAGSVDIGCGRITGFFTGGRPEVAGAVSRLLAPVAGLGPFTQVDIPIVGTDNLDFMLEGVAHLVANHEPASYGPNYHARSDEFDRCDPRELRLNTAIVGALVLAYANDDGPPARRQTRAEVEALMQRTDLADQMKAMGMWDDWASGRRGRAP